MKTFFKGFLLILSAGLIIALSLTGCTQYDDEKDADQLNDSKQTIEQIVSKDRNDTATENNSEPVVRFERERTFGSTDEILMGEMGPIAIGPNSEVFITDSDQSTIHVFQSEGNYLKSLGRQGRGPGQFMMIYGYTTIGVESNQLYVTDLAGMTFLFPYRMHLFSLENLSFSKTIDLLAVNKSEFKDLEGHYSKRIFSFDDGSFLVSYHRSPNEYQEQDSFIHYVIQDSTGTIIGGPVFRQKDRKQLKTEVKYDYEGSIMTGTIISSFPFFGKSILTVSGDDIIFAVNHTEEFKIDIYSPQGEHIRTIEHAFENSPFNKEEVMDEYERTNYKKELGEGVAVKIIEEAENLPDSWPAIQEMLIDDENRLWVSTIVEDFDIYEWWIMEETGEMITKFKWPRDEPIEVVKNGKMYTRQTDEETGLQEVVRYRIEME